MLEYRPITNIVIGYILGIIMGLYCKISIVFFYLILGIIYPITIKKDKHKFKLISFRRYIRYIKIIITKKAIKIIVIISVISNTITLYQNYKYDNLYNNLQDKNILIIGTIASQQIKKENKNVYKLKIKHIQNDSKYKNTYLYINIDKKIPLEYGDTVAINGMFKEPETKRNYKGFDYKEYLKTLKIYGSVNVSKIDIIKKGKATLIKVSYKIKDIIKDKIKNNFSTEVASLLIGLTLGDAYEISQDIKKSFSESNISHILAISGMHIGYIIISVSFILYKIIGKRKSKIGTIFVVIIYMFITGFSPSVVRAGIMGILTLLAGIFYRKSDTIQNLSLSLLVLLMYNPFLIKSTSLLLSFMGTIGIIILQKNLKSITISASIFIIPIMALTYNKIALFSLIISMLVGWIIGPIIILGFLFILIYKLLNYINLLNIYTSFLEMLLQILINIANFGSKIPLNKLYVTTPSVFEVIIYYIFVIITNFLYSVYHSKKLNSFQIRVKNLISLAKYKFRQNKEKIISIVLIICLIIPNIKLMPKNLKIYFIDVGQGDSTLFLTPLGKTILIDGGGSSYGNYNVGENTLLHYLLDRKIKKVDYIIVSHFDTDHVQGLLYVMSEIKVKNIVIGKQFENSENYQKFLGIIKEKKIKVKVVEEKSKINIEKNLYFDVLWPSSNNAIQENSINNNALVCKLKYKNFSMLFTGDIEEDAEKVLIEKYKNTNYLKSTILKVAHHGSKSSSTQEFLDLVKPKISLIGVGKDNKFGHPSDEVVSRLNTLSSEIYRTDNDGEISIVVNRKGIITKINKCVE